MAGPQRSGAPYLQRAGDAFWFERLPEADAVYVAFRSYEGLRGNAAALMRALDREPARTVIVDLRLNRGGDFNQGRRHVVEPLRRRLAAGGIEHLYAVADRRTFSAAMVNTIDLRRAGAVVLGEPPGQRPNSYQEKGGFRLPHSALEVSVSIRYYRFLDTDVPAFRPDHVLMPTWQAIRSGRDVVLDWVIEQHATPRARP